MNKPTCKVRGMIAPGAMCGSIIVGLKYCGFSGGCEHKSEPIIRACNSEDCNWEGQTDRMCGSVGPLCPECGETTEVISPDQSKDSNNE